MNKNCDFSIYFAGDAYSTSKKIMGRQSAGKAFLKGIARTWPNGEISGIGHTKNDCQDMLRQLQSNGFEGSINWSNFPSTDTAQNTGALYFPSPCPKSVAHLRNISNPRSFSLMGVTFTLSSAGATDGVAELILPPFQPWDALICISQCAKDFTLKLHQDMKDWWTSQVGPIKFNEPQLPVIMLGVDAPYFETSSEQKRVARQSLAIHENEIVFLFSGRLSFHAKANPAPMYQALEKASKFSQIVCIEAGVFPNNSIKESYLNAQRVLAPSVRFIWADGKSDIQYKQAWQASDTFISLSDNIQETFGLTPVEAMAAGLPVIITDWNGYKETVRNGIDGFRVPTVLPPGGVGGDLALRHAMETDSYDFYIGRTSLATVVDPNALAAAIIRLATDQHLRLQMSLSGLSRARELFDWPIILEQYAQLANELKRIRDFSSHLNPQPWPQRSDPFSRFAHFSTTQLKGDWTIKIKMDVKIKLKELLSLNMANYALDAELLPRESINAIVETLLKGGIQNVNEVLKNSGQSNRVGVRVLMFLWKFDLIQIDLTQS